MPIVSGKKIVFGVTGGIASYKAADWVRSLTKEGAEVTVIMTASGTEFVAPLTFAALSGNPVLTDIFTSEQSQDIPHISIARNCDLLLIAPATANTIAKMANGLADDLLSTMALATEAPVLVFPAMNSAMYLHPATQANQERLRGYGHRIVLPSTGAMACSGESGPGRLPEWDFARANICTSLSQQDLAGERFLITAGPTHEPIDPVRYLGNRSSGKMGYALALSARQRGAEVTLISGPSCLPPPPMVETIKVDTAEQMYETVLNHSSNASVIIKAAAVADFRPQKVAPLKIKKGQDHFNLPLSATLDILKELGNKKEPKQGPLLVGFAAESDNHLQEGLRKLTEKNLDMIVINDILGNKTGFEADTNQVTILERSGAEKELPLLSKTATAHQILDRISSMLAEQD